MLEIHTQIKYYMMVVVVLLKWNFSLYICHTEFDTSLLDGCSRSAQINSLHDDQQGVCVRHEECHAGIAGPHVWSAGRNCGRWHGVDVERTVLPTTW